MPIIQFPIASIKFWVWTTLSWAATSGIIIDDQCDRKTPINSADTLRRSQSSASNIETHKSSGARWLWKNGNELSILCGGFNILLLQHLMCCGQRTAARPHLNSSRPHGKTGVHIGERKTNQFNNIRGKKSNKPWSTEKHRKIAHKIPHTREKHEKAQKYLFNFTRWKISQFSLLFNENIMFGPQSDSRASEKLLTLILIFNNLS